MAGQNADIVCFRQRYYIHAQCPSMSWHDPTSCEHNIVASLCSVSSPEEYKKWLADARFMYGAMESKLEKDVYKIRLDNSLNYFHWCDLLALPSEIPLLESYNLKHSRLVNLDREFLTVGFSTYWKLSSIPLNKSGREMCQPPNDAERPYEPFPSMRSRPDNNRITSPALELPKPNPSLGYRHHIVTPRLDISEARKAFLTRVLAEMLVKYKECIILLGPEWSPDSFPFREFSFALVSIASGTNNFFSLPYQCCNPRGCHRMNCGNSNHRLSRTCGFIDQKWAGSRAPLLEFGAMCHRQGDTPGASPAETVYWFEDVLVSLTLMNDGEAQGRQSFQIVVLSLFQVTFAEVSIARGDNAEPLVKVSDPLYLSLLHKYCIQSRNQPTQEGRSSLKDQRREVLQEMMTCPNTVQELQSQFPGLAALVNFFDVATNRRVASTTRGIFPAEIYDEILQYVDYDTWKACASVSTELRFTCLSKYRINENTRIARGPVIQWPMFPDNHLLSFEFENPQTGQILPAVSSSSRKRTKRLNWMPLIGIDREVLMFHVIVQFEQEEDEDADIYMKSDPDHKSYVARFVVCHPTAVSRIATVLCLLFPRH
ncbi:hypothetical protein F5Y03DRAFT_383592 [Xylaria venustula]|nr:hypothetical protein F5Y03DRAFT_383592 [Xylaria venustula]